MASLDALFKRMMIRRPPSIVPGLEISMQEVRAMAVLSFRGRTIMSAFAEALSVPLSTATHTVDRLSAKGLVQRSRPDDDRRVVEVELSEAGKNRNQLIQKQRLAMMRSMLATLSPQERAVYMRLVAKMARMARFPEAAE